MLAGSFAHPGKISSPLLFRHIQIYAGEFFAEGALVKTALNFVEPRSDVGGQFLSAKH